MKATKTVVIESSNNRCSPTRRGQTRRQAMRSLRDLINNTSRVLDVESAQRLEMLEVTR